jgi:hypothetical protein
MENTPLSLQALAGRQRLSRQACHLSAIFPPLRYTLSKRTNLRGYFMKTLRFIVILFALLGLLGSAAAQSDLDNHYDWPNGIRVSYPDSWDIVEEDSGVHLRSDETDILFAFVGYQHEDDVDEALENLFLLTRSDSSIEFESDNVFSGSLSNFSHSTAYFFDDEKDDETIQRALFAIVVDETIIVQASAEPRESREIDELSVVLSILSSLEYDASRVTEAPPSGNNLVEGVYRWPSGVSIQYTEGWEIVEDGEIVHIVNPELDIAIYLYPVRDERDTNRPTAIRETFARVSTKAFDEENYYFLTLANDSQALGYAYEETLDGATFEQLLIALQPDEIFVAVAVILPRTAANFDAVGGREPLYEMLGTMSFE